ncbi:MAG: hypothetical protein EBR82_44150 [Caulobacteraceae bacterium]|nr:hypothetical protein [Caulobacteraceae bacterium]
MTLDDLVKVYIDAFEKELELTECEGSMEHAGIRAVIKALRDECDAYLERRLKYDASADVWNFYNDILTSDGEVAAGGPTREDGRALDGVHSLPVTDARPTPAALSPHVERLRDLLARTSAGDLAAALHDLGFKVAFDMTELLHKEGQS